MTHPKRKRKKSTALSTSHRRHRAVAVPRRRSRRKKGLFDASGSGMKTNALHAVAGLAGGSAYGVGVHLAKSHVKNQWVKAGAGVALAMGLGMAGMPFVAAGAAGAAGSDLIQSIMQHGLNDGEMNDVEYVHPDTLSDSGMMNEMGEAIVMDDEGMCYSPDEDGTYHAIGDVYSLQDATDIQGVSMVPLQAQGRNPYNLASNY